MSFLADGMEAPTVQMQIWDRDKGAVLPLPGGAPVLRSGEVVRDGGKESLALSYGLAEGLIVADCRISLDEDGASRWRVSVTNRSEYDIVAVEYPNIPAQIGTESRDDILIYPLVYGERQVNPLEAGGVRRPYPGLASMQWMDLYDRGGGLYLGSHDQTFQSTDVSAVPFPADNPRAMMMSFAKFGLIRAGEGWESAEFIVAPHAGDWHCGADRYRRWRATWFQPPPTPQWLADSDGWFGVTYYPAFKGYLKGSYGESLREAADMAGELGLSHVGVWGQMVAPVSGKHSCSLYVAADPAQGGAEALAKANTELREEGFHLGYYMHAWASALGMVYVNEELAKALPADETEPPWKVTDPDSQVASADGEIGTDFMRVMCASAPKWQDYLRFWVLDKYAGEYDASGMYLDVLSIHHERCFSDRHGPYHVGDWGRSAIGILRSLREEGARISPDFFLAGEGVSDVYGQFVDVQLISRSCMTGSWVRFPYPEVIHYTCPDLALLEGFANGIGPVPETGERATPEYVINHCHLLGNRYDMCHVQDGADPEVHAYMKRVLTLRRQFKQFLYKSRFMDNLGLWVPPGVEAKWFAAAGGPVQGALITITNTQGQPGSEVYIVGLPEGVGSKATAYALDREPEALEVTVGEGKVRFEAPAAALSAVLLTR